MRGVRRGCLAKSLISSAGGNPSVSATFPWKNQIVRSFGANRAVPSESDGAFLARLARFSSVLETAWHGRMQFAAWLWGLSAAFQQSDKTWLDHLWVVCRRHGRWGGLCCWPELVIQRWSRGPRGNFLVNPDRCRGRRRCRWHYFVHPRRDRRLADPERRSRERERTSPDPRSDSDGSRHSNARWPQHNPFTHRRKLDVGERSKRPSAAACGGYQVAGKPLHAC